MVSFDGVAKEESTVDEAFSGEENPDLGVPVLLKLSVDPKPEIVGKLSHSLLNYEFKVQITTQGPCLTCGP